jgi:hypothetical protein
MIKMLLKVKVLKRMILYFYIFYNYHVRWEVFWYLTEHKKKTHYETTKIPMEVKKIKTNLDVFFFIFPQKSFRYYHVSLVQLSLFIDKENKK